MSLSWAQKTVRCMTGGCLKLLSRLLQRVVADLEERVGEVLEICLVQILNSKC
jgi:hypothetical protein